MASFTELIAQQILQRRAEFLAGLSREPGGAVEQFLAAGVQAHWHRLEPGAFHIQTSMPPVAAVDGSQAIRALNIGADWIIAQALLIGPNHRRSLADTRLLRGEIEHTTVNRYASLLMRSLELDLALEFVQNKIGKILLLDGSLYADLPHLLYSLPIGGYEDYPLSVLEKYLTLFDLCQKHDVLLLGISKSARSAVLGHALLEEHISTLVRPLHLPDSAMSIQADVQEENLSGTMPEGDQHRRNVSPGLNGLPTDGEILSRWTVDAGLTDPVLLGSASFGHMSAQVVAKLALQAKQAAPVELTPALRRVAERLHPFQQRLLAAPAIGTFYLRLAPGEDILRVDVLASALGRNDLHLLEFPHEFVPSTTACPIVRHLRDNYGGASVYNAALYVVDQEVRLHAETVDRVYLPVLRRQLGYPVHYDRSTRRFFR